MFAASSPRLIEKILFAGFFGWQFWVAYRVQREASKELQKLEKFTSQDLPDQKIMEETISLIPDYLDLSKIDFRDSNLIEANLSNFKLPQARFSAACLIGTKFMNADLTQAEMQYADLTGANLQGAILEGANLLSAKILNTDLKGAKLKGVHFSLRIWK